MTCGLAHCGIVRRHVNKPGYIKPSSGIFNTLPLDGAALTAAALYALLAALEDTGNRSWGGAKAFIVTSLKVVWE